MNAELHTTTDNLAGFASPHDQALISETEYQQLRSGLIPSYARKWIVNLFGGVPSKIRRQLVERAVEEEYEPSTAIAIVFGVIADYKTLRKWAAAEAIKSYQSITPSRKVDGKWVDLETTLWPPYEPPATRSGAVNSTIYHRPARYVFKHGNIRVDLGAQEGKFSPIPHNNPNSAMQSIATRLGRRLSGDYNKVAQQIVGNDNLIATTTSMRVGNQWIVLVTMMRDPKLTPASYHVTMEGTVVSQDAHHPANSVSEVTRALIKGIIEEEDEHCAEYSYEFDQDMQSQMLMQPLSDKLNTEEMTASELMVHDIAAVNDDLIDFMNESATYVGHEYDQIVDTMVEDEANRLYTKYNTNRLTYSINSERERAMKNSKYADPQGKEYIIQQSESRILELIEASNKFDRKLYYRCLIEAATQYDDIREAIECATMVYPIERDKSFFTYKGTCIHRKRFFGIPSAYNGTPFMPSHDTKEMCVYMPITEYVPPIQRDGGHCGPAGTNIDFNQIVEQRAAKKHKVRTERYAAHHQQTCTKITERAAAIRSFSGLN